MIKYLFYSISIVALCTSCFSDALYEENKAITNRAWSYEERLSFVVNVKDKRVPYDIYINLRHTNDYDFSNLFVLLHEKGSQLKDSAYRKEIPLAALDGRWLGKSAGNLYEIQHLAKEKFLFPDTGDYTFSIEQNMRENPLKNVVDVGIKVVQQ